ncbi:MAG TPA: hypothetical protein VI957_02400 [Candidatus Paceibacterota bacterium]
MGHGAHSVLVRSKSDAGGEQKEDTEYPVSGMKYQGKSTPEQARPRDGMDPYREMPE